MESDDYFPILLLYFSGNNLLTDFAAAYGLAILLLCFVTFLSAAENAISHLSQDDMSKVEENGSARDKTIIYLSDRIQLLKASCGIVYFVVLIIVTALCIYATSVLNLASFTLTVLIASSCTLLLWAFFYGFAPKIISRNKLGMARVMSPVLKMIVKAGMPFMQLVYKAEDITENETHRKKQVPLANEAPNDMFEEKEMLEEIIHFYNKKSNEIMTPRTDIEAIDIKSSIDDVINMIVESGYSRIPVYNDNEDNIKGVLFAKDIIPFFNSTSDVEWQSLIRKPFFVPETKKIYGLLEELRSNKTHMAIVVDEFGCTSGLVTMEDIIEEIIGDISDEYDEDEHSFVALPDGSYIFEGKTRLNDFFRETGIPASDFNEHTEEAETLTGLMLAIKGTLPGRREVIEYRNYRFRILEANERLVLKIKFSLISQNN